MLDETGITHDEEVTLFAAVRRKTAPSDRIPTVWDSSAFSRCEDDNDSPTPMRDKGDEWNR